MRVPHTHLPGRGSARQLSVSRLRQARHLPPDGHEPQSLRGVLATTHRRCPMDELGLHREPPGVSPGPFSGQELQQSQCTWFFNYGGLPFEREFRDNGGVNIVLGVSGGIAAYKAVLLLRLLVEEGHDVHVVPTKDALRFVGLPTWESLSKNTVTTSVHEDVPEVRHVALGQQADLVIVAPATANTLAKMASGL